MIKVIEESKKARRIIYLGFLYCTNFGEDVMIIDQYTKEYRKNTKQDTGNIALV